MIRSGTDSARCCPRSASTPARGAIPTSWDLAGHGSSARRSRDRSSSEPTAVTDSTSPVPTARREATTLDRQAGWAVLRVLASIAVVLAVYYWLPLDLYSAGVAVTILVIGVVLLIALI